MTQQTELDEPPTRIPWPPILIVATIGCGLLLDRLIPLTNVNGLAKIIGGGIVALALLNDIWCATIFRRRRTTILPHRAVSTLITSGPYRRSRNPIYVSHVAFTFGLGLLLGSPWIVLLAPALAWGLAVLAILPEERHLSKKFGSAFAAYAARTPRWL
jgi:protein-S-isoprenylcysteine O-methyltransferase Ste14